MKAFKEKAKELVGQMDLLEKASQLRYDAPAIKRLGIPTYNWWNESLHGVARAGVATVFPQAIGMAAMFDEEAIKKVAEVTATEGRAKYNAFYKKGDRDIYKGLTFWAPNINIFRDPRWGRGHETYGEDPYLTSRLGVSFIKALQGDESNPYWKAAACAKHFAVHSGPEEERHHFDAVVSKKDLYETYLPAFEVAVKEGKVAGVMGAYNRVNGEPACGSKTLLVDILKKEWGFDGYIVSDCWAIRDFHTEHMVTRTAAESAALAINNGCELNCGNTYLHMMQAYNQGLVSEETITESAEKLMQIRMKLGLFDENCEYNEIPYEVNDCKEHNDLALEVSRKSMVMLKNNGILPLNLEKIKSIGVIGPTANNRTVLEGNYNGTPSRYTTLVEGIQDYVGDKARVYYSEGCHLFKNAMSNLSWEDDRLAEALIVAEQSDVVVLCLGLDSTIEGEQGDTGNAFAGGDKITLNLIGKQQQLLEKVVAVGKPTILVLSTGSAMAINFADEHCDGIIQTWYPGAHGGKALAQLLFGEYSPSGKLPVTFYKTTEELPDFEDYSMKGRTYRYMQTEALYPFGYGLGYGKVSVEDVRVQMEGENAKVVATVMNQSDWAVDEVVQVYIKDMESKFAVPNFSLCAFKAVHLAANEKVEVTLTIEEKAFTIVDEDGKRYRDSNFFKVFIGTNAPDARSVALTGLKPIEKEIHR
ncbi:MAG: glycoside hydrolase family 3 protein [Cellulosilyticum sp.]|nr:glycoside hydrolase family 3 protein [Cellulosilyticum sp.]